MNNNRQKIVDNVDIVDEVSKYIDIEPKGRNYVAICPFHADSNPSLTISPEKRIFKCFVCGEGGDVVNFVSKYEKISQSMAIKQIAENNKIKIDSVIEKVQKSPLDFLINDIAIFYQSSLLLTNQGKKAQQYLADRNINSDTIKHFKLGFGYSESKSLYHFLEKKMEENQKYTDIDIEQINQFSNHNDMFVNRLIIPITSGDKIVGFGGREIDNANSVKYLNSKDSSLFHKKEVIFNLDDAIAFSPDRSLVITEGYFDVISAFQNNIKNACAIMGTSFTSFHIDKIRKKINKVFLALDSDKAGQDSTIKIGNLLTNYGIDVEVINFINVKDLDEYFQTHNYDDFELLKKSSIPYKLFQTKKQFEKLNLNSYEQKEKYLETVLTNINGVSPLLQDEIFDFIKSNLGISSEQIKARITSKKAAPVFNAQPVRRNSGTEFIDFEDRIILKCIKSQNEYKEIKELLAINNVNLNKNIKLFQMLEHYYQSYEEFDEIILMDMFEESHKLLSEIYGKLQVSDTQTPQELIMSYKKQKRGYKILK